MRNFPVNSLYLAMSDPVLASIADATCEHAPMGDPTSHLRNAAIIDLLKSGKNWASITAASGCSRSALARRKRRIISTTYCGNSCIARNEQLPSGIARPLPSEAGINKCLDPSAVLYRRVQQPISNSTKGGIWTRWIVWTGVSNSI
jgi:hypothetical protein